MIRAVLFDAVGTLIRLREPVGDTYARFAAAAGIRVSADALQSAFATVLRGMPPMVFPACTGEALRAAERDWWRTVVRSTFDTAGVSGCGTDLEPIFTALFDHFAGSAAWQCAAGALEVLTALRARGLATGMVSNFDYRLPALLGALQLAPLLDTIVLPADAGAAKPDARIFALALSRLGVGAEDTLYVGDDAEHDMAGATRAGLRAVDVATLANLRALLTMV